MTRNDTAQSHNLQSQKIKNISFCLCHTLSLYYGRFEFFSLYLIKIDIAIAYSNLTFQNEHK